MPTPLPRHTSDQLTSVAHEFGVTVEAVIRHTDKTVLAKGTLDDRAVAIKVLLDSDEFWRSKFAHEIAVYRSFTAAKPPVVAPDLLFADEARVLVVSWLEGHPLGDDRYLDNPAPNGDIDAVLATVEALNTWRPPAGAYGPVLDYAERIGRYRTRGFLADADATALHTLLARHGNGAWEFNHGDLLPSNLLITPEGRCAPLDWEFAGFFLPGYDLAFLHTTMAADGDVQQQIERIVTANAITGPWLVNLAMVLTRELRIHTELPVSDWRDERLHLIQHLWDNAHPRIHRAARTAETP